MISVDLTTVLAGVAVTGICIAIITIASLAAFVHLTGRGVTEVFEFLNEIGEERRSERLYQKYMSGLKREHTSNRKLLSRYLAKRDRVVTIFHRPEAESLRSPLAQSSLSVQRVREHLSSGRDSWGNS